MNTLTTPGVHTRPVLQFNHVASTADEKPAVIVDASEALAPKPTTTLKTALGDQCNLRTLADKLQGIIQDLPRQLASAPSVSMAKAREQLQTALATQLKSTLMYVCEDSSHPSQPPLPANRLISLEAFLLGCGTPVPKTLEALVELRNEMAWQAQVHPLGNLGGGLSWPSPMPAQHQNRLVALLQSNTSGLPGLPLADGAKGALGYLLSGSSVSEADLKKPLAAIEKLLDSAKAQALGQAMLSQLGGSPPGSGGSDYVLTAIHLGLDPESLAAPARNSVAGFDLAQSGQRASVVVDGLARHLVAKGRTSAQTASLGAYLLLARTAPEFLVKDIPPSVTYGSVLWAQLAMAVGKIEAQAPGRTLGMGYAEILLTAEKLPRDEVSEQIEYQALKVWDATRKFETTAAQTPSSDDMERARTAFNEHLDSLKTTSVLLQTPIPSRKADGLAQLKAAFPGIDPKLFEVRNIQQARLREGRPGLHPGMRSMLDIVMEGVKLGPEDHWISKDKRLPIDKFCALYEAGKLGVATAFKTAYDSAINAHQQGHQNVVRHLISTLPLEDRENLEFGKLEFFHTNQYTIAGDLFTPPALHVRGHTLEVKTTRDGQVNIYLIDTRRGTIEKQNFLTSRRSEPYTDSKMESREANILTKTVRVAADQIIPEGSTQSDSFNSRRSHLIADVFVKSLDLKNDDLLREARDVTSYDQDSARNEAIGEFFLNLIPLRSAIVNFQNGNIGQGIFDLAVDAVGLLTLGAGKAAQAGKVASKALSSMSHLAKAARFVGATAVEAFNPLSGVGDLLVGGGRLLKAAGRRLKQLPTVPEGELGNRLFREFKVPESRIAGLSRNNQGVYVAADGHRSHIRHTDSTGQSSVYEVRQVTRTVDGKVQARVYHNNRQTGLQLEHVQGDQWRRLGLAGGHPTSIKSDLGPVIGQGAEGTVYASLDGKRAYKDLGPTTRAPDGEINNSSDVLFLNKYYGDGFARKVIEDGRLYLVMGRIDGVDLAHIARKDLPPDAKTLLADTLADMEAKGIFMEDLQLKNFMYSAKDKKIYPVDMAGLPGDIVLMMPVMLNMYTMTKQKLLKDYAKLLATAP